MRAGALRSVVRVHRDPLAVLPAQTLPSVANHLVPLVLVQSQHREREDVLLAQAEAEGGGREVGGGGEGW